MFQTLEDEEPLKFHYIAHTALDVLDEKIASRKETTSSNDMYLSVLFPTEVYKIYGYVTNSKTKIIVVADDSEMKDNDMKSLFQKLHALYVDAVSNPFYVTDKPIGSKKFEDDVSDVVSQFSAKFSSRSMFGGSASSSGGGGGSGGSGGMSGTGGSGTSRRRWMPVTARAHM